VPSGDELRQLMQRFHGNVTHVSNHLGRQWAVISRALHRYGIDPGEYRAAHQDADDLGGGALAPIEPASAQLPSNLIPNPGDEERLVDWAGGPGPLD
jgi:hypothetical protein